MVNEFKIVWLALAQYPHGIHHGINANQTLFPYERVQIISVIDLNVAGRLRLSYASHCSMPTLDQKSDNVPSKKTIRAAYQHIHEAIRPADPGLTRGNCRHIAIPSARSTNNTPLRLTLKSPLTTVQVIGSSIIGP